MTRGHGGLEGFFSRDVFTMDGLPKSGWAVIQQKCMRLLLNKTRVHVSFAGYVLVFFSFFSGSYGSGLRVKVSPKNPEEWVELDL